jgi:hypothetical protein
MRRLQGTAERSVGQVAKTPPDAAAPNAGRDTGDTSGWHTRHPFFLVREGRSQ